MWNELHSAAPLCGVHDWESCEVAVTKVFNCVTGTAVKATATAGLVHTITDLVAPKPQPPGWAGTLLATIYEKGVSEATPAAFAKLLQVLGMCAKGATRFASLFIGLLWFETVNENEVPPSFSWQAEALAAENLLLAEQRAITNALAKTEETLKIPTGTWLQRILGHFNLGSIAAATYAVARIIFGF